MKMEKNFLLASLTFLTRIWLWLITNKSLMKFTHNYSIHKATVPYSLEGCEVVFSVADNINEKSANRCHDHAPERPVCSLEGIVKTTFFCDSSHSHFVQSVRKSCREGQECLEADKEPQRQIDVNFIIDWLFVTGLVTGQIEVAVKHACFELVILRGIRILAAAYLNGSDVDIRR